MSKRVLVVDDAMFMRTAVKRILGEAGFEIVGEAENGEMAVSKYGELQPDVVIMDITMPVMDGISAVRNIVQSYPGARIVMCTALGQQNLVIEALQAGAKDYIVKPFQPSRVVDGISKVLGIGGA
jgi:two-component system chemotaxis response regulator CheY